MPIWVRVLLVIVVLIVVGVVLFRLSIPTLSPAPSNLGVTAVGELNGCPESPNCVSTSATTAEHAITPLLYSGDPTEAQARLVQVIEEMGGTIQTNDAGYIHAIFRTSVMGYIDDAEFYFGDTAGEIQLRSAARLGYSDMGVNRQRMEDIRTAFAP
ncbi:MAG: DUF1499 domain-containing protein [Anaerolineales bacterium]|nr:DUF1499 domain-containing protein [Anaerolineales bacterium]